MMISRISDAASMVMAHTVATSRGGSSCSPARTLCTGFADRTLPVLLPAPRGVRVLSRQSASRGHVRYLHADHGPRPDLAGFQAALAGFQSIKVGPVTRGARLWPLAWSGRPARQVCGAARACRDH